MNFLEYIMLIMYLQKSFYESYLNLIFRIKSFFERLSCKKRNYSELDDDETFYFSKNSNNYM